MEKKEIERIKRYCEKATEGPWNRSLEKSKYISAKDRQSRKSIDICQLTSGTHTRDWHNYHFLANARVDLPKLANECLELHKQLELTSKQLELVRANKQLEIQMVQMQLEQVRTEREKLHDEMEKLQASMQEKQREFEKQTQKTRSEIDEIKQKLESEAGLKTMELEQTKKELELERANKMELFDRKTEADLSACDGLLNELDRLEATLSGAEQLDRLERGVNWNEPCVKARQFVIPGKNSLEGNRASGNAQAAASEFVQEADQPVEEEIYVGD